MRPIFVASRVLLYGIATGFSGILFYPHMASGADFDTVISSPIHWFFAVLVCMMLFWSGFRLIRLKKEISQLETEKNKNAIELETLGQMLEKSSEGILVIQNLRVQFASNPVLDIMNQDRMSANSTDLFDYIHPDDADVMLSGYEKLVFSKTEAIRVTIRIVTGKDQYIWVNFRGLPFVWQNEPAVLVFMRDVTEQKMMETDLQQAQRMEAIGILSGGIAHDFNNILTSIVGNSDVALMDLEQDEKCYDEFIRIRESAYRARDLVQQILNIARDHGPDTGPVYLSPIIKEAIKMLRSTLSSNIRIKEKIEKQLHLIQADATQIYQVFMNLCTNAKSALEGVEDPLLTVGLENIMLLNEDEKRPKELSPGPYVRLSVKDNGCGMDQTIKEKIFQPYFTTKPSSKGTGLGLATVLGIVKQNKGYIHCDTESGKGTCFSVYLPVYVKNEKDADLSETIETHSKVDNSSFKILFVDDEKEITALAERVFKNLGFKIMTVNSGRKALEKFALDPEFFDLLITDLGMPEMTGEKLASQILRIRPEFPVIACTGHSETYDEMDAKHSGVKAYVKKPYDFKELSALAFQCIQSVKAA